LLEQFPCNLQLNENQTAIEDCTKVIEVDNNNTKAYFRRGKARSRVGDLDNAKADLQKARELEDLPEIRKELIVPKRRNKSCTGIYLKN